MKPNCFIVGAPKCATTALAEYLAKHPSVYLSPQKEPMFWCTDVGAGRHEMRPRNVAEYEALFRHADPAKHRVVLEASTGYLRSDVAVVRLLDYASEARMIAMVRDPVEVAHAFHMEQVYVGLEPERDFERAWRLQDERAAGSSVPEGTSADQLMYRDVAALGSQLTRLFARVPDGQRMVLLQEDLRTDPDTALGAVLEFLCLTNADDLVLESLHGARVQRFPTVAQFVLHPPAPLARPIRALRLGLLQHPRIPGVAMVKRFARRDQGRDLLRREFEDALRSHFAPEVERLEALLDRDLAHWKRVD
ncbi:MAG: hypothetical protein AAGA42_10700 [Actinomycetota bacterium]